MTQTKSQTTEERRAWIERMGVPSEHSLSQMGEISRMYDKIGEAVKLGDEGVHGQTAMRYGISPKDILSSQKTLKSLGYDIGATGADSKWGEATEDAYQSYLKDFSYGHTDEEIFKINAFNAEVREYMKKRAKKYNTKPKAQKPRVDKLIDSMKKGY